MIATLGSKLDSAELCRRNGWRVGTQLVSESKHGHLVIEITAIGERRILTKTISVFGNPPSHPDHETVWFLSHREWKPVPKSFFGIGKSIFRFWK